MVEDKDIEENKVEEAVAQNENAVQEEVNSAGEDALVEVETSQENLPAKKKKKEPKSFPASKLPGILKRNYKADRIEKLLYKKIFVSSDRQLLESLFEENPKKPGFLYIPRDKMIEKLDFKRLKLVGKDLKSQKGSFRWLPFIAVAALIFFSVVAVITFKNPLAKKGLTYAMQNAFGARTDIGSINVEILNATVTVRGLQQANKSSPMKNLFAIDKTQISFSLTEALRGKFYARNIEVTGLAVNTDRTYSGELPGSYFEPNPATEKLMAEIMKRKDDAIEAARVSIENAFAEYNPVNMIENVKENLKTPGLAKDVQGQVTESVARWKAKPQEMKKQIEDFSTEANAFTASANVLVKTDFSKMNNAAETAETIEKIRTMINVANSLVEKSKGMTNSVKGIVKDVASDAKKVQAISVQVADALKSDTALVKTQLNKITSFNLDTGTKILGNALDSAIYAAIGSYYPYVQQISDYAMQIKAKASESSKEEQKKAALLQPRHERLPGIDVYWTKNRIPKFLIENIKFSGLGVDVKGVEISSDMDKRGAPAVVTGTYAQGEKRIHRAAVVVDARSNTKSPLVGLEYSGDNYPFAFKTPYLELKSNSLLKATGSITEKGAVTIGARLDMGALALSADPFEPAIAHRFYTEALEAIDSLVVGAQVGLDERRHLTLKIESDLDRKFNAILRNVVNKELKLLIDDAQVRLTKLLNENCSGVMEKVSEFVDIENGISAESIKMDKIDAALKKKKAELEAKLKEQTSSKINDALKNSGINIPTPPANSGNKDAAKDALDALKGLIKK